jgi:hypothetical protein
VEPQEDIFFSCQFIHNCSTSGIGMFGYMETNVLPMFGKFIRVQNTGGGI